MMQSRADLHTHSRASDGLLTPTEMLLLSAEIGLGAIALTDHDTIAGLAEARQAAEGIPVSLIKGVEISCIEREKEVHILGLFIDPTCDELSSLLKRSQDERYANVERTRRRLRELGAPIDLEDVQKHARGAVMGRAHFAKALVDRGHVSSPREAFDRFLGEGKPGNLHRPRPSVAEASAAIHASGGIACLAHPGGRPGLLSQEAVERMSAVGLDAIEVHHPAHDERTRRRLSRWAERLGLAVSGGSDFHGANEGAHLGTCWVDEETVESLRGLAARRRKP